MTKRLGMERREPSVGSELTARDMQCSSILRRIVKLTKNFRSHPDILHYPNQVFYAGDLRPHGKPAIINAYSQWSRLPKKGFPIIFHAVEGEDKREASSPSYFNIDEITQVKKYVKMLLEDKKVPISEHSRRCLV